MPPTELLEQMSAVAWNDQASYPELRDALATLLALSKRPDFREAAAPAIYAAENRMQRLLA